ncbi:unnamed protein product, partial [Thlaspi arvense]
GTRIYCSIKKQHLKRYDNHLSVGSWKFIEEFNVTNSIGQYRTTKHCYRISFVKDTIVSNSVTVSDSEFLDLVRFSRIHEGIQNQSILCDVLGQIVNVGQLSTMHVNNKEANKIDFELRDEIDYIDMRLSCTLWGNFADQILEATSKSETEKLICLIRFGKIKEFRDVKSVSNAFDASLVIINPSGSQIDNFVHALPDDGLALTLHLKVMDTTSEITILLFDTSASEMLNCQASELLNGSFNE